MGILSAFVVVVLKYGLALLWPLLLELYSVIGEDRPQELA